MIIQNKKTTPSKRAIYTFVITVLMLCLTGLCSPLAYAADESGVTWSKVFVFIENNFPDPNMQKAVKREVQKYYSWNGNEDEPVLNETDNGPESFKTPEETLSWIGEFEINTKTDKISNLEGLQHIGKEYWLDTGDTKVYVVFDGSVCLQEIFGNLWGGKTELYCKTRTTSGACQIGCLSDNGYIGNLDQNVNGITFVPRIAEDLPRYNQSKKTPLIYLRDGTEKKLSVHGKVVRHTSKQDMTEIGETTRTKIPASLTLKDPEDKKWELISTGADESDIRWILSFHTYDMFYFGTVDDLSPISIPYDFIYKLQINYYSSIDVSVDHEIYGGFTFTKTSANDTDLKLKGAEFIVSNARGEYLVSEGTAGKAAVFDKDIRKAKIYITAENGEFQVDRIPIGKVEDAADGTITAQYYVTEIKSAPGYRLDNAPKKVDVTASTWGIQMDNIGGETDVQINSDGLELMPQWEKGKNEALLCLDGKTTDAEKHATGKMHTFYVKNGGKQIDALKYETESPRLEVLQDPDIVIKDLDGTTVGTAKTLKDAKLLLNDFISKKKMKAVTDSYTMEGTKTLIYYDKDSTGLNSNKTAGNDAYQMRNTPLAVNLKLNAIKTFVNGETLAGGEFQFTLIPDAGNPDNDPLKSGKTITNDADGKINFGQIQFANSGVYKYILKETDGGTHGKRDDITYDTAERSIEIAVKEADTNGLTATVKITENGKADEKKYTAAKTNAVSYPHLADKVIQNDQVSQVVTENYEKIDLTEFINSKNKKDGPSDPKDPQKPSEDKPIAEKTTDNNPATGDASNLIVLLVVMIITGVLLVIAMHWKKKRTSR